MTAFLAGLVLGALLGFCASGLWLMVLVLNESADE